MDPALHRPAERPHSRERAGLNTRGSRPGRAEAAAGPACVLRLSPALESVGGLLVNIGHEIRGSGADPGLVLTAWVGDLGQGSFSFFIYKQGQ